MLLIILTVMLSNWNFALRIPNKLITDKVGPSNRYSVYASPHASICSLYIRHLYVGFYLAVREMKKFGRLTPIARSSSKIRAAP